MEARSLIWVFVALIVVAVAMAADPVAPLDIDTISTSRRTISAPSAIAQAQAGNVSELSINSTTVTTGWQGYYGNISGQIVLDDAKNNTLYRWDLANANGQIYATRDTDGIDWSLGNIVCANITHIENEESTLNFNLGAGQDADGVNETFTYITHPQFNVSSNGFKQDMCNFTTSTYVDDTAGPRSFNETLLYSEADTAMIYMAFIVPGGADGFRADNIEYDFQMLVAEDGHQGDSTASDYYFYVEIS